MIGIGSFVGLDGGIFVWLRIGDLVRFLVEIPVVDELDSQLGPYLDLDVMMYFLLGLELENLFGLQLKFRLQVELDSWMCLQFGFVLYFEEDPLLDFMKDFLLDLELEIWLGSQLQFLSGFHLNSLLSSQLGFVGRLVGFFVVRDGGFAVGLRVGDFVWLIVGV